TIYTCGAPAGEFSGPFAELLKRKGVQIAGKWHCRGFDTYGPFKLIGGLAKGRPDKADFESAVAFVEELLK
ncbi:MAG: flavodoxin, partial [Christensenella sp.]